MKEIKVAVAMNGGVSLAVWIGGVATEIYRCHEGDGIYGKLQDALDCEVRVDVITGASAGGLNGVLLGTALAQGLPVEVFERLKQTWLQVGDFAALLRDPLNRNPPSLMKGNEVFLPEIERLVLSWLSAGVSETRKSDDLDIYLTTTPLEPGALRYLDTLGTELREPVTRASFRFNVDNFAVDQDGRGILAQQLALAARASASFPAAFEPVYINARSDDGSTLTAALSPNEVDMTGIASITSPRWVMDGGVLVNKPVGPAIKLIQGKPNETNGRRVLLYVVPDPGTGPADLPADLDSPPTIASVVTKSLFTLPRAESIAADLQSMREHNRAVRRQRDVRAELLLDDDLRTAVGADKAGLWPLAQCLYPMWKLWRDHRAADERIDEFLERADGDRNLPVKGQKYTWQQVIEAISALRRGAKSFLPAFEDFAGGASTPAWTYGHQALGAACETLQDLTRRVLELKLAGKDPTELELISTDLATHRGTLQLIDNLNSSYWQDSLETGAADDEDSAAAFAERLFANWPIAPETRRRRNEVARQSIHTKLFDEPATDPPLDPETWQEAVRSCEQRIAGALDAYQRQLSQLVGAIPDETGASSESRKVIQSIANLQTRRGQGLLSEHLALHIASSLMGADDKSPRQIDFIQISGDIDCPADPTRLEVSDKVTGVQLGHFGAFYKESWRANDWMWGRIDGAMQLIGMLLQPDQVRARFTTAKAAAEALALAAGVLGWTATAVNEDPGAPTSADPDDVTRWNVWQGQWAAGVRSELNDFFTKGATTLKATVRALALIAQLEIARAELPDIVSAIERSHVAGGALPPRTRSFVMKYRDRSGDTFRLTLAETRDLLPACNVARERIKDEVGSDLLTSTAATTAGIAVTALSGERAGAGVIGPLVKTVRTAVLTVYLVAQNAVRRTRTAFALTQLLLAFGGATIALDVLGGDVPSAVLVLAYVAITGWVVVTALSVGAVATLIPLLAAVVLLGAALMGRGRAAELFGDPKKLPLELKDAQEWKDTQERLAWIVPAGIGAVMAIFYKLRTRSLLRRLTLPEVRARIEKIWSAQSASSRDDELAKAFTDLVSREVDAQRRLINRSRRATWLSLIIGGLVALAAGPLYRWIFLREGGHENWVSVAGTFEGHRVVAVVLTIAVTLMALSLIRLMKLSVLGGRAGALPRWRPRRWLSKRRVDRAAKRSEQRKRRTGGKPSPRPARWLGFGVLPGDNAHIWYGRIVSRATPQAAQKSDVAADPSGYMVRLSGADASPMPLRNWLGLENPGTRRVITLHVARTGALIPRRALLRRQRNTRFIRAMRKVPIMKSWGWVKWSPLPQIPTAPEPQD